MAQLAMGLAGAAIGFAIGGPQGAAYGFSIGTAAGGALFPPKLPDGPRLNDRQVQSSAYGETIPRIYGVYGVSGNIIWATEIKETEKKEGGKGGGPEQTTYSYSVDVAISICQGPISGIRRIWADGKLIWDRRTPEDQTTQSQLGEGELPVIISGLDKADDIRVYDGTETQTPDPYIQSIEGDAPAYRGEAYIVFQGLKLDDYGARIPQFKFEVATIADINYPQPEIIYQVSGSPASGVPDIGGQYIVVDPNTDRLFVGAQLNDSPFVFNPATREIEYIFPKIQPNDSTYTYDTLCYVPVTREIVLSCRDTRVGVYFDYFHFFDADSFVFKHTVTITKSAFTSNTLYLLRWNPIAEQVLVFNQGAFVDNFYSIDPFSRTVQTHPLYSDSLAISNGALVANVVMVWTEYGTDTVAFYDAFSYTKLVEYELPSLLATPQDGAGNAFNTIGAPRSNYAFDTKRNRIVGFGAFLNNADTARNYLIFDGSTGQFISSGVVDFGMSVLQNVQYSAVTDEFICWWDTNGIDVYSAASLQLERHLDYTGAPSTKGPSGGYESSIAPGWYYSALPASQNGITIYRWRVGDTLQLDKAPLASVVAAECALVGLDATDIETTKLTGGVRGFMATGTGSGRGVMEALMNAYQFDAVESGGKLKFVSRSLADATTIDLEDLAAHDVGSEVPTRLPFTRADEIALPTSITLKYSDQDIELQQGAQVASRFTTNSLNQIIIEVPAVFTPGEAKVVAEIALYTSWAGRTSTKFTTTRHYSAVEPTDLVTIDGNTIRITKKSLKGNMLEFEGSLDTNSLYAQTPIAGLTTVPNDLLYPKSVTNAVFLDIPILRDSDNTGGFYIAANGYQSPWRGAAVFKSTDNEAYYEYETITQSCVLGKATTALSAFYDNVFDEINTVRVVMINSADELESKSMLQVLNGSNGCLVGDEILQYRNATLNADYSYTLSGLLRGRRGTRTDTHTTGERFVVLTNVFRTDDETAELDLARYYKTPTFGTSILDATASVFTNTGIGLRPFAPVHVGGGRKANKDLTINWIRSSRIGTEWQSFTETPVGETSESYEIDIINPGVSPSAVVRTLTATTNTATYTAAQQVTDFGSPAPATVTVRIYQMSSTYGRGMPAQAVI
jgi:hypothetical protein